jgi:hypothetical protein
MSDPINDWQRGHMKLLHDKKIIARHTYDNPRLRIEKCKEWLDTYSKEFDRYEILITPVEKLISYPKVKIQAK